MINADLKEGESALICEICGPKVLFVSPLNYEGGLMGIDSALG